MPDAGALKAGRCVVGRGGCVGEAAVSQQSFGTCEVWSNTDSDRLPRNIEPAGTASSGREPRGGPGRSQGKDRFRKKGKLSNLKASG